MEHEYHRYYFEGPNKSFHTKNAAQRHAEWKEKTLKEEWNRDEEKRKRFVSVSIKQMSDHFLVDLKLTSE